MKKLKKFKPMLAVVFIGLLAGLTVCGVDGFNWENFIKAFLMPFAVLLALGAIIGIAAVLVWCFEE